MSDHKPIYKAQPRPYQTDLNDEIEKQDLKPFLPDSKRIISMYAWLTVAFLCKPSKRRITYMEAIPSGSVWKRD